MAKVTQIRKRDGRVASFEPDKIASAILKAFNATGTGDGAVSKELAEQVTEILERKYAGRIPGVEEIQDIVEEVLIKNGYADVARAYILYRQQRAELRAAKAMLGVTDDLKLNINAIRVLQRRYLLRDEQGNIVETPSQLFRRVAKAVASADRLYDETADPASTEEKFYRMMAGLEFLPNSPTLMNAGAPLGQLAACFVIPVEDSIVGIFDSLKTMALIHQSGGGTGFSFSGLRPSGDIVKSTKGVASGPVSFMRVFDVATDVIKQGGKRRGANMGVLRVDHPDILEFITSKIKEDALVNFNISVGVTDAFMEAVKNNADYDLINPRSGEAERRLNAREVFDLIVNMAWRTGDPGIIFLDEINRHNPTPGLGRIEATNPCVTGDTLVATSTGLESIASVVGLDREVLVDPRLNGGAPELKRTTGIFKTGVRRVYRLKTRSGYELRATADHPILTPHGWRRLIELRKGDTVLIQSAGAFNSSVELPFDVGRINTLTKRRMLALPKVWSRELGQVMGWLIGDGALTRDKAIFYFRRDEAELLPYFAKMLNSWNGQVANPIEYRGVKRLQYHASGIVHFFVKLGVKRVNSPQKEVPSALFTAPKDAVAGFLQALFTADGTVGTGKNRGQIRLTTASDKLAKQVQLLLLNFGIKSRRYNRRYSRSKPFTYLTRSGGQRRYESRGEHYCELVITGQNLGRFMHEIGFLPGKKGKAFTERKPNRRGAFYRDSFEEEVDEIHEEDEEEVYDLTEPTHHSFIANGIVVHNCGEVPLLPYESCILGSVNLSKMVRDGEVDWEKLRSVVRSGVHFLDNVIDINRYPIPEIERATKRTRKIGIGVMGFAEMLLELGIPYNSEGALKKADEVMRFISEEGHRMSAELAERRGSFPAFPGSIWEKRGYRSMRNATVTTIAPTGTISIIAGTTSGIEPLFAVAYIRNVMSGIQLVEVNRTFERMAMRRGFYSRDLMLKLSKLASIKGVEEIPEDVRRVFVTAFDVSPDWHVRMQAVFQRYTDNAVSKTINLPRDATPEDVRRAFMLAYSLKCKGITVYRYGSKARQVLSITPQSTLAAPEERYVKAGPDYSGGRPSGEDIY